MGCIPVEVEQQRLGTYVYSEFNCYWYLYVPRYLIYKNNPDAIWGCDFISGCSIEFKENGCAFLTIIVHTWIRYVGLAIRTN